MQVKLAYTSNKPPLVGEHAFPLTLSLLACRLLLQYHPNGGPYFTNNAEESDVNL